MHTTSRREFLGQLGVAAFAMPLLQQTETYDLLIAGGHVIESTQKLSAERDVAISNGQVVRIAANIPRNQARQVFDAKGKIVTPGIIDVHAHVYDGIDMGISPDLVGIPKGVTTIVDDVVQGDFEFLDSRKTKRVGHRRFVHVATVRAGKLS